MHVPINVEVELKTGRFNDVLHIFNSQRVASFVVHRFHDIADLDSALISSTARDNLHARSVHLINTPRCVRMRVYNILIYAYIYIYIYYFIIFGSPFIASGYLVKFTFKPYGSKSIQICYYINASVVLWRAERYVIHNYIRSHLNIILRPIVLARTGHKPIS